MRPAAGVLLAVLALAPCPASARTVIYRCVAADGAVTLQNDAKCPKGSRQHKRVMPTPTAPAAPSPPAIPIPSPGATPAAGGPAGVASHARRAAARTIAVPVDAGVAPAPRFRAPRRRSSSA